MTSVVELFASFAVTITAAPAARSWMLRQGCVDVPNHRSSHVVPTARGGGVACLLGLFGAVVVAVIGVPRKAPWAHGLLNSDEVVLADIRELDTMRQVFQATRPIIFFHAAALKHLPLLESHPLEAWKSNVLTAAAEVGVGTFVNISTDKAANPTCVLGYSKRIAERLTADFAQREAGRYVSVRFGNVLGSRGSVVPAFTAQIERGGPVTVTHPDVERFFMLIPEACQLVLGATSIGLDGEVMVLDMGQQVRIVDVAQTLIRISGRKDIDIVYTGLRPGEKLGEHLFSAHERQKSTSHPLVSSVEVPEIDAGIVRSQDLSGAETWMRARSTGEVLNSRLAI